MVTTYGGKVVPELRFSSSAARKVVEKKRSPVGFRLWTERNQNGEMVSCFVEQKLPHIAAVMRFVA